MTVYAQVYSERDGSVFQVYDKFSIEFREASHRYWLHTTERIPSVSVTTALGILEKRALYQWYGDGYAEGAAILAGLGELDGVPPSEVGALVRLHKLGAEAKRDAGADRGTAVHAVLERWGCEQTVPDLADFPPEHQGYVQGLCAWLLSANPKPSSVERLVGSVEHGYAGRLDMRAHLDGADSIIDLKTSKGGGIWPEAHLQSRAYAMADVECGSPPPDRIVIVGVAEDGSYKTADCCATEADWLNVLAMHRSLSRLRSETR